MLRRPPAQVAEEVADGLILQQARGRPPVFLDLLPWCHDRLFRKVMQQLLLWYHVDNELAILPTVPPAGLGMQLPALMPDVGVYDNDDLSSLLVAVGEAREEPHALSSAARHAARALTLHGHVAEAGSFTRFLEIGGGVQFIGLQELVNWGVAETAVDEFGEQSFAVKLDSIDLAGVRRLRCPLRVAGTARKVGCQIPR